jgi:hypothetical protein
MDYCVVVCLDLELILFVLYAVDVIAEKVCVEVSLAT